MGIMQVDPENNEDIERCWFCENTTAHVTSAAVVEMHAGGFLGREYRVIDKAALSVPRCVKCKVVHERVEGLVGKGALVGLLIGVTAVVTLYGIGLDSIKEGWRSLLIGVAVFGMAGGVIAWVLGRIFIPKGVKDQKARDHYPAVSQKVKEGWKIGPKPPGL